MVFQEFAECGAGSSRISAFPIIPYGNPTPLAYEWYAVRKCSGQKSLQPCLLVNHAPVKWLGVTQFSIPFTVVFHNSLFRFL